MCIRKDFGRSGSFETPTQENSKLPKPRVQAVSMIPSCLAGTPPVLPPPESLALSSGRAGAGAWLQAVVLPLLASRLSEQASIKRSPVDAPWVGARSADRHQVRARSSHMRGRLTKRGIPARQDLSYAVHLKP